MVKGAANFIKNRKAVDAITYRRITDIVWYVFECYQIILKDAPVYSRSAIINNTTLGLEDYLKMELVDSYLALNKHLIASRCSELEGINFHYENQKRYLDITDNKVKPDKIDIYINRLGLQESWNEVEENVYFVIECKRIGILSDCQNYIGDTEKFANRDYQKLRLPFEGQLAFIENVKLNQASITKEIDKRLKAANTIITNSFLNPKAINNSSYTCYTSDHKRNYQKKKSFTVFHLLFDYSSLIVN